MTPSCPHGRLEYDIKSDMKKDKSSDINTKSSKPVEHPLEPVDSGIVVEEQVLERNEYDNTISFKNEIEKAKAEATSHRAAAGDSVSEIAHTDEISEEEKERIKRSLAEMREVEQEQSSGSHGKISGLFGKIKGMFADKE